VKLARARQFVEAVAAHDLEATEALLDADVETVTPRGALRGIAAVLGERVLGKRCDGNQFGRRSDVMNKAQVAKLAVKTATRYPKPTVTGAKFVVRHRKGLLQSVRTSRKAKEGSQHLISRASDPRFREEVAAAMSTLGVAARRARKVGATGAVEDKRVRELIGQAASHLMIAVRDEPKPQGHKLRNLTLLGLVAGGAYFALKGRSAGTAR
jgi:hypothetical protein